MLGSRFPTKTWVSTLLLESETLVFLGLLAAKCQPELGQVPIRWGTRFLVPKPLQPVPSLPGPQRHLMCLNEPALESLPRF